MCIRTLPAKAKPTTNQYQYHKLRRQLAGDIELNPGPRKPRFPCGECNRACSSYKGAKACILCESCEIWFHSDCVGLTESVLNILGRSELPWECYRCGLPNLSSGLFDSIIIDHDHEQNSSASSHVSHSSSSSTSSCQPGSPLAQSSPNKGNNRQSPKNLRLLEINFQSIFSKRVEFWSVLDATKADVIFGRETWLKPSITNGEIFPPGYDIYRRDRSDERGGVLLAVHSSLNSHQINLNTDTEIVAAKISNDKQSIILASVYRPTDNNIKYAEDLARTISDLCQSNQGAAIWIAGDTNLPDINWETHSICSYQYRLAINEAFLNLLDNAGLDQLGELPYENGKHP